MSDNTQTLADRVAEIGAQQDKLLALIQSEHDENAALHAELKAAMASTTDATAAKDAIQAAVVALSARIAATGDVLAHHQAAATVPAVAFVGAPVIVPAPSGAPTGVEVAAKPD